MEITIDHLYKTYPNGFAALKDINLTIGNGMFGLLGPNGAGKSTLMKILVTLLSPSSGDVSINGLKLSEHRKEVRSMLGYLPQDFRYFPKLKTWEFLDYAASMSGVNSRKERAGMVDKMLEDVGLFDVRSRFANKLSGGMKRRLGIAQALIGHPRIIVVDEPTTGLDPEERIRFRNILGHIANEEVIIILSTHIVGDISSSCNQMALINQGEVKFAGSPEQFVHQADGHVFTLEVSFEQLATIKERYNVITSVPGEHGYTLEVVAKSIDGFKSVAIQPNLEHAYVYFMETLTNTQ